jgi:hypothetical protein
MTINAKSGTRFAKGLPLIALRTVSVLKAQCYVEASPLFVDDDT